MRKRGLTACLLLAGALFGSASNRAWAQPWDITGVSGAESRPNPLPIGSDRPDDGGLFVAAEFLFMHANRNIGSQLIAVRGFRDSDGSITGISGQFIGSQRQALSTEEFGRTTWTPGLRATIGYKFQDGGVISASYTHLDQARYNTTAGPIPVDFNTNANGEDSFLFSPVFGFSPQFSGPPLRLADSNGNPIGSGGSPYGIWNGANVMNIKYLQRFDNWDVAYRMPVYETDYSRSYAIAGGRHSWIFERFTWQTFASNYLGQTGGQDGADYVNTLSQRMYGPMIGCGNDIYLGQAFALKADVTGSMLLDVAKQRAKYELFDESTQSKRGRNQFNIVPNVNASLDLSWYPIGGMQVRVGYEIWTYFNTVYMDKPVGFDAGAIDPSYLNRPVRIFHGFTVGISYNF